MPINELTMKDLKVLSDEELKELIYNSTNELKSRQRKREAEAREEFLKAWKKFRNNFPNATIRVGISGKGTEEIELNRLFLRPESDE